MANQLGGTTIQSTLDNVAATSPTGAAGLGGTPDQAKMAGTPAAKKGTSLSARRRTERGSAPSLSDTQRAAAEQAQKTAEGLRVYGSLGGRVQNLIAKKLGDAAVTAQGTTLAGDDQAKYGTWLKSYTDALNANNSAGAQKVLEDASVALGQSTADVAKKFGLLSETDVFQQAYQAATPDKITLAELKSAAGDLPELDTAALAAALGVDPATVEGMTAAEVDKQLQDLQSRSFSRARELRLQLQDPNAPLADYQRTEAENELQALYASGMVDAEEMFASVLEEIQRGSKVNFQGKELTIEELLKDEEATGLIASVLADPTDKALKELQASGAQNPLLAGIANFISKNRAALGAALATDETAQKKANDTNTALGVLRGTDLADLYEIPAFATTSTLADLQTKQKNLETVTGQFPAEFNALKPEDKKAVLESADPVVEMQKRLDEARAKVFPSWAPRNATWEAAWQNAPEELRSFLTDDSNPFTTEVRSLLQTPEAFANFLSNEALQEDFAALAQPIKEYQAAEAKPHSEDAWLEVLFDDIPMTQGAVSKYQSLMELYRTAWQHPTDPQWSELKTKLDNILGPAIQNPPSLSNPQQIPTLDLDILKGLVKDRLRASGIQKTTSGGWVDPSTVTKALRNFSEGLPTFGVTSLRGAVPLPQSTTTGIGGVNFGSLGTPTGIPYSSPVYYSEEQARLAAAAPGQQQITRALSKYQGTAPKKKSNEPDWAGEI